MMASAGQDASNGETGKEKVGEEDGEGKEAGAPESGEVGGDGEAAKVKGEGENDGDDLPFQYCKGIYAYNTEHQDDLVFKVRCCPDFLFLFFCLLYYSLIVCVCVCVCVLCVCTCISVSSYTPMGCVHRLAISSNYWFRRSIFHPMTPTIQCGCLVSCVISLRCLVCRLLCKM